jgi:hypothetical protein
MYYIPHSSETKNLGDLYIVAISALVFQLNREKKPSIERMAEGVPYCSYVRPLFEENFTRFK